MQKVLQQVNIFLLAIILIALISLNIYSWKINEEFNAYEGSLDNGRIHYKIYVPKNVKEAPVAVLLHGFGGSSEMMNVIASALAENKIIAIAYDIPGHGKSVGSIYKNVSDSYKDFLIAVGKAREFGAETNTIAIVGHSMGAGYAQTIAKNDTRVKCLILLGASPSIQVLNQNDKINLLVLNGAGDEIVDIKKCLRAFENVTGLKDATIGRMYGSFKENNAREFYVSEYSDHLTILYNGDSVNKIVSWITGFYNLEIRELLTVQRLSVYVLTSITTFIATLLIIKLISYKLSKGKKLFIKIGKGPILIYFLMTFLASSTTLLLQTPLSIILPLFISDFIIAFFYTQIAVIVLTFYLYRKSFGLRIEGIFKKYFRTDYLIRRVLASIFLFALTYLAYTIMFENFLNVQLPFHRLIYFILSTFLILLYTFFNELFFRGLASGLGKSKLSEVFYPIILRVGGLILFYASIMTSMILLGYSGGMIGYLLIVIYMFAILQIGLDLISSTMFITTRSITEQVIFTAIMYSAIITSISPMI